MFRKDRTVENRNLLKQLQDDRFLRERLLQQNKPDLSCRRSQPKELHKNAPEGFEKERASDETTERDVIVENKLRQQIRENSPEIRELESKLRLAYVNKLRSVQMSEKNAFLERERIQKREDMKILADQITAEEKEEELKAAELSKQKVAYRKALDEQISKQNAQLMSEAYLDLLTEKMMVDEIVARIIEEDRKRIEMQLRKSQDYRNEIEQFLLHQEEQKKKEKRMREEENQRILAYVSHKDLEQQERYEHWRLRKLQSEWIQDRLLSVLEQTEKQLEEERNLCVELAYEVKAKEAALSEERLAQRQMLKRMELRDGLEQQLDFKAQKLALEKEEERLLKEQMLESLSVEHKLDQLSSHKRRLKQLEHRRSVDDLIRQRRVERQRVKQLEKESLQKLQQIQADRQRMIEEERDKILQEHASKLLGYLPKGLLHNNHLGQQSDSS